jgi:polyhydroxybutyrate depolymerase
MNFLKKITGVLFILILVIAQPAWSATMEETCANDICSATVQTQGVSRQFYYFSPPTPRNRHRPPPIVFMFHDSSTNARSFAENVLQSNLNQLAMKFNFIIVYPEAANGRWNFGPDSTVTGVNDLDYVNQIILYLQQTFLANTKRVYAAGMGNGGMMAMRLGCEMADQFKAIAAVDAAMPISLAVTCKPSKPVSALFIESHDDAFLPWDKKYMYDLPGMPTPPRLTIPDTVNLWALLNKLYDAPKYHLMPLKKYDGTWVYVEEIRGVTNIPSVILYTVYNAGHTWPGGGQYLPYSYVGKVSNNLDASTIIWDFFEFHY